MGTVIINPETTKKPIEMIGKYAGECWGSNTTDEEKNYKRGLQCLRDGHGRTFEFPDVYITIDGYSARVIREWYTHIGGSPTRLQASTRYIDYESNFNYIIPPTILQNKNALQKYLASLAETQKTCQELIKEGIPREDVAMLLPLGMSTKIVCKHNLRNLMDMSRQRMCSRAYWEYRALFNDLCVALSAYSPQWETIVKQYFKPKCDVLGGCPENNCCGRSKPLST